MEKQRFFIKQDRVLIIRAITLVFMMLVIVSCDKSEGKSDGESEEINNRGMLASEPSEVITKFANDFHDGINYENLLAPSINYNEFHEYIKKLFSCGPIILSNKLTEKSSYQKYIGVERTLPENHFFFTIFAARQVGSEFHICATVPVIIEKNSKTNKYYIIEYIR